MARSGAKTGSPGATAALEPSEEAAVAELGAQLQAMRAESLCFHGDTPGAPRVAATARAALEAAGVVIRGLGGSGIS